MFSDTILHVRVIILKETFPADPSLIKNNHCTLNLKYRFV